MNTQTVAETKAQWLETESIKPITENALQAIAVTTAGSIFVLLMLHDTTPIVPLLVWFACSMCLCLTRAIVIAAYLWHGARGNASAQKKYLAAYINLFYGFSFLVAFSSYFVVEQLPAKALSTCLLYILLTSIVAMIYTSCHWRSSKNIFNGFVTGLLVAELIKISFHPHFKFSFAYLVSMAMCAFFVWRVKKSGENMNHSKVHALSTQFDNAQLITSLTHQTEVALNAIATKNRLIASTAHDMRQPILALDLYTQWLAEDHSQTAKLIPKISLATRTVISQFDSMFDLSQIAEDRIVVNKTQVCLSSMLDEICTQYRSLAENKKIELRSRQITAAIYTDPQILHRMVSNLVTNAIKYTQTGGVLVACRQTKSDLRIEVWDTGIGIAAEEHALVFDAFYKSQSQAGTNDGFGLGLSIVTQLAEKLGFKLSMKSRVGRGTMVAIEMPESNNISIGPSNQ